MVTVAASIFALVLGAILYLATDLEIGGVDLDTVGVVLMVAGCLGIAAGLLQHAFWARRGRRGTTATEDRPRTDHRPD